MYIAHFYNGFIFHSDIDECVEGFDGCDHNCTNTNGSYFCTCLDGYELQTDNHTCTGDDSISYVATYNYVALVGLLKQTATLTALIECLTVL